MQLVLVLLCILAELSVVAQVLVLQLLQVLVRAQPSNLPLVETHEKMACAVYQLQLLN